MELLQQLPEPPPLLEPLFSLELSLLQVPQVLVRELVRMGAIARGDTVCVVEKDKSREDKVSFHFTLNIVGIPTIDLKVMFERVVLAPYKEVHSRCRDAKSRVGRFLRIRMFVFQLLEFLEREHVATRIDVFFRVLHQELRIVLVDLRRRAADRDQSGTQE